MKIGIFLFKIDTYVYIFIYFHISNRSRKCGIEENIFLKTLNNIIIYYEYLESRHETRKQICYSETCLKQILYNTETCLERKNCILPAALMGPYVLKCRIRRKLSNAETESETDDIKLEKTNSFMFTLVPIQM